MAEEATTTRRRRRRQHEAEEIEEEEEEEDREKEEKRGEQEQVHHRRPDPENPKPGSPYPRNAFAFWAYLTLGITLLTLILAALHPLLRPHDDHAWFLSLPPDLRLHYSSGRLLKDPRHPRSQIFVLDCGPRSAQTLLLLPGLAASSFSFRRVAASLAARGLHVVALDLPGSGFSDPLPGTVTGGPLSGVLRVYNDVREKGIFWGFDQLVEKGYVEQGEDRRVVLTEDSLGAVVGRVIEELGLARVHLVLHDSAVGPGTLWAEANREKVGSVSFVDTGMGSAAFPSWVLAVPVLREVVLGFRPVFRGLLRLCCTRGVGEDAAEAFRMMLKGKAGQWGVVELGRGLNFSFDLGDWARSEEAKGLPMMVLWSQAWTDLWIEEGRRISSAIPDAKFVQHFGGRWPQEDAADEIAGNLAEFVLSLPKSEFIQDILDDADKESSQNNHQHGHSYYEEDMGHRGHHGDHHEHTTGHMGAYPGWGI